MSVQGRKEHFQLRREFRQPVSVLCHPQPDHSDAGLEPSKGPLSKLHLYWRFLVAGITRHTQTGGVVPSQRFLIDQMISAVPADYRGRVVELGPGTGVLTLRLAARCPSAEILACEINPDLAQLLQKRLVEEGLNDRVEVVSEPAEHLLPSMGRQANRDRPDFIISGIPLGNLARESVLALLGLVRNALAPGGVYIQFQHSLLDRKKIKGCFSRMRTVPVLLNFPPAVVYYAWK